MNFIQVVKIFSIPAFSFVLWNLIMLHYEKKSYNEKKLILKTADNSRYKMIFTTLHNIGCVQHVYKNITCGENCSNIYLQTIVKYLSAAKGTISLCMYHLTLEDIYKTILEAHSRNVNVRVISDHEMMFASGSKIKLLESFGIKVKTQPKYAGLLHHKFCLVDECNPEEAAVLFGSMNFTMQGVCNNWDHFVITNNPAIIEPFRESFEYMWNIF